MEEKSAPQGTTFLGHECNVEPQEKAGKEKKERVSASLSEPLTVHISFFPHLSPDQKLSEVMEARHSCDKFNAVCGKIKLHAVCGKINVRTLV